jgi:hypothetical protein
MVITFGLSQTQPGVIGRWGGSMAAFRRWAGEFLAGQMVGMAGLAVAAAWLGVALASFGANPSSGINKGGKKPPGAIAPANRLRVNRRYRRWQ